jgi:hypothetical protein
MLTLSSRVRFEHPALRRLSCAIVCIVPFFTGCGSDIGVGELDATSASSSSSASSTSGSGGAGGDGSGTTTGTGGAGGSIDGPVIGIRLRASTAAFPHADGLSGQTPIDHRSGVRKFQLFQGESDPAPLTIFDLGEDSVEVGYNDGDDTLVFTVPVATLPTATYTLARVVHSHVRYRVGATMHANGLSVPGEFDNLQVLSDGSRVDGELHDAGYYEYVFETGGMSFPASGDNAPIPEYLGGGGFSVKFENGEWAYYFPVLLPLTPDLTEDLDVVMEVNMHESFRWTDQQEPSYTAGVFDTTPVVSEPVLRFGANTFGVVLE